MKKQAVYVVLAQLCILAAWQLLARSGAAGLTVPTPASVLKVYLQPRFAALLYRSALATVSAAAKGLAAGALLGTVTALVAYLFPPLRPGVCPRSVIYMTPSGGRGLHHVNGEQHSVFRQIYQCRSLEVTQIPGFVSNNA